MLCLDDVVPCMAGECMVFNYIYSLPFTHIIYHVEPKGSWSREICYIVRAMLSLGFDSEKRFARG